MSLHAVDTGQSLPPLIDVVGDFDASANTFSRDSGGTITGLKQGMVITITNAVDGGNNTNYTLTADASTTLALGSVAADESNDTVTITPIIGHNTPTNPTLVEINSTALAGDINCFEIYKTRGAAPANTLNSVSSSTVNRLYPTNTTIDSHQSAKSTTPGYKIHSDVTLTNILSGSSLATANDYFVLIYSDNGNKHHFAKITEVLNYDNAGDGFEFEPRLKEDIPEGTKFAVYKGPSSTNTDLVAVSYGLTGTGDKHNHYVNVSRPTFYFYNDRIDNPIDNELAHNTKYEVRKSRYDGSSHVHSSTCFLTNQSFGPRLLDKSPYKQTVKIVDTAHTYDSTVSASTTTHYTNYAGSAQTYTANLTSWDTCFLNASRPVYTLSGGLASGSQSVATVYSGPSTHLSFVESPEITKILENVSSVKVSKTVTVSGNYAELEIYDFEKVLDEKIKMNDDFKVRSVLYQQKLNNNYDVNLPGKVHTNTTAGQLEFQELGDEQDLARLLGDGETIRIDDYIYVVASIASKSAGTQVVTIDAYKTKNAATFTTGTTIHDTLSGVKAFRRAWSTLKSNLLTNAKIDTEVAADGTITKNGITVTTSQVDYRDLNIVLDDGDLKSYRLSVDKGDKNNQYFELNDSAFNIYQYGNENRGTSTVTSNSVKYIAPIINYVGGGAFIDNVIFDGTVEYINSKTESTQMKYTISGRDDLGKLLAKVNNKKYLYSDEYVYSTMSPISQMTDTGLDLRVTSGSTLATQDAGSANISTSRRGSGTYVPLEIGDRIYYRYLSSPREQYILLGIVSANTATSDPGTGVTVTVSLETPLSEDIFRDVTTPKFSVTAPGAGTSPFSIANSTEAIVYVAKSTIMAGKSLSTNQTDTDTPTTLRGSADKGINFISGKKINVYTGQDSTSLVGSKSDTYVGLDNENSLGYTISNTVQIDSNMSPEGFVPFNSDGTENKLHTVSSMTEYDVIDIETLDDGLNNISVAPIMPTVLGRIDSNTARKSITNEQHIYLINKGGLPSGGILHLLNSEAITNNDSENYPISFVGKLNDDNLGSPKLYATYSTRFGSFMWRYSYLEDGSIYYQDEIGDRITNTAKTSILGITGLDLYRDKKGNIRACLTGVRIDGNGQTIALGDDNSVSDTKLREGSPETRGPMPVLGSNFYDTTLIPRNCDNANHSQDSSSIANNDHDNYREKYWGRLLAQDSDDDNIFYVDKMFFEANDPKAINTFLFALGDIYPDSMTRPNHIGYPAASRSFTDYSLIFKASGTTVAGIEHDKYVGQLTSKRQNDASYDILPVNTSSISPNTMKRFGVVRLVEMTMDWHFNNVDVENKTDINNYTAMLDVHNKKFQLHNELFSANDHQVKFHTAVLNLGAELTNGASSVTLNASPAATGGRSSSGLTSLPTNYINTSATVTAVSGNVITISNGAYGNASHFHEGMIIARIGNTATSVTNEDRQYAMIESAADNSSNVEITLKSASSSENGPNVPEYEKLFDHALINHSPADPSVSGGDIIQIVPIEIYADPLTGSSATSPNRVFIGTVSAISGATITLGSNYSGPTIANGTEVYFSVGPDSVHQSGTPINIKHDFNVKIQEFNSHIISGSVQFPWFVTNNNAGYNHNKELIHNQLISPLYLGNTNTNVIASDYGPLDVNKGYSPFKSSIQGLIRSSSRVINEMLVQDSFTQTNTSNTSRLTEVEVSGGSKIRNNMIGLITRGYKPNAFFENTMLNAKRSKDVILDYPSNSSDNTMNVRTTGVGYASEFQAGAYLNTKIGVDSDDLENIDKFEAIYFHPRNDEDGGGASDEFIRLLSNKFRSSFASVIADAAILVDDMANAQYGSGSVNFTVGDAFLLGMRADYIIATTGMTFPIVNLSYPKGDGDNYFYSTSYGQAYLGSAQTAHSGTSSDNPYAALKFDELSRYTNSNKLQDEGTGELNSYLGLTKAGNGIEEKSSSPVQDQRFNETSITGAEVYYKPVVNLQADDVGIGGTIDIHAQKRRRITFSIYNTPDSNHITELIENKSYANDGDDRQLHRWIHFCPDLTGYYLVSEEGKTFANASTSNRAINNTVPTFIHKIISHTIEKQLSETSNTEYFKHVIEIDNANTYSTGFYRVMRISQDTFYDFTPSEINLLTLSNSYSKVTGSDKCYGPINRFNYYDAGFDASVDTMYNEGLLSMFMPINIDVIDGGFVDIRSAQHFATATNSPETVNGVANVTKPRFVDNTTYQMSITDGHSRYSSGVKVARANTTPVVYRLEMSNIKAMGGVVSFGEIFTLSTFNKPKFNGKRCSIGTNFQVVDEAEQVINDLIENTDITYTQTTDTAKYYEAFNVQGLDSFSAVNFVASLKNRKLIVDGKTVQLVKDIEDEDYTNIEFNEFDADNRIGQISRDNNLFDFFNQITVYGDGVKSTVRDYNSVKKDGLKELEEVDLTIVTEEACKRKAMNLLRVHSESSPAISFKVLYEQCPYLRPGQIININYPSEKIARGEYIVLEINYEIGGFMDVKVGKYAKNLTNRIAELLVQGKRVDAALRGDRYKTTTPSSFIQEEVALRAVKLKVQYTTATSTVANVFGFTTIFGVDTTLGITVPTGESTQNLEYDLL
jgi:hypothetical protein